ncbi:prostatic acid phosphatase-like isoform X1 [Haliotis cracherodii]|uniref:prostatic acid phosphatase-like isoform X1 n=1 Tax=Haliotis cracherodii TaxID=6455 RepID=UPI0039E75D2D
MLSFSKAFHLDNSAFPHACLIALTFICIISTYESVNGDVPSDTGNATLSLVQILFRHGDRAPLGIYPTDKYKDNAWPVAWGMLTDIGADQSFLLGRFLRDHYKELNFGSLTDSQVYVRSTSVLRARMTAECVMAGILLANVSKCDMKKVLQPIKVHYKDEKQDQLLSMAPCPLEERLKQEWRSKSTAWGRFLKSCEKLFMYLSKFTGWKVDVTNILRIADTVYCEIHHNLTQPQWMLPEVSPLMNVFNESSSFAYPTSEVQKLGAGPLVEKMLSNIMQKMNKPRSQMKLFVYSAHDSNVIAFLSALRVFNTIQPPYTACVILELYQMKQMYFVKVLYRNDTTRLPYTLKIPGCATLCPVATLNRLLSNVTLEAESRGSVCGSSNAVFGSTKPENNVIPLVAAGILILIVVVAVAISVFNRRRHRLSKHVTSYRQLLYSETYPLDSDEDELLS